MNRKKLIMFFAAAAVLTAAVVIGLKFRGNHRQIVDYEGENPLENVHITQLYFDDLLTEERNMYAKYEAESNYILKIRCTKKAKFDYQSCLEYGEVVKVFKDNGDITVGDNIVMDRSGYHLFTKEGGVTPDIDSANTGFVNLMKKDKEYLVFIEDKITTELYAHDIYTIDGWTIAPIFCYEDMDNVIVDNGAEYAAEYKLVKDNEGFFDTEDIEQSYYKFKHRILRLVDEEYNSDDKEKGDK